MINYTCANLVHIKDDKLLFVKDREMSISFVGGIQFVGLIAPHIAKKFQHQSYTHFLLTSGVIGAIILLMSDLVSRTMFLPIEIPAGVFPTLIGSPFFMYLLFSKRLK